MERNVVIRTDSLRELIDDVFMKNITEDDFYEDGKISDEKFQDLLERYNAGMNCYDNERDFVDMVKTGVIEKLEDYKGEEKDICDLGYDLTECENVNGSWYCSTYKAVQDLSKYFSVFMDYQEWWMNNYGEPLEMFDKNGYFEPERIHCCMMIDAYRNVFERAFEELEDYNFEDNVMIDDEFIEKMTKAINDTIIEVEDIF